MRCTKCGRRLKKGYYFNGSPYGPECIKGLGYKVTKSTKRFCFTKPETNEKQIDLFGEENEQNEQS
jgi:hypothetical protein